MKTACSKAYGSNRYFTYWWDLTPRDIERIQAGEDVCLVQKDTGARVVVSAAEMRVLLTPMRQTSRGIGNWGIRVLRNQPECLYVETPYTERKLWPRLAVKWELDPDFSANIRNHAMG